MVFFLNYFCSKEIMVDNVAHELEDSKDVDIIIFDIILLSAYVYYAKQNENSNYNFCVLFPKNEKTLFLGNNIVQWHQGW